ncbi:hypothetical protein OYC64_007976 [Pagothenia borchgrevinki]|uniref:Uncharacterized protein n=1 Tax=Pagothenia borchgrevinki TaxID=8213 RepID=A0ABD2GU96_PAGBO
MERRRDRVGVGRKEQAVRREGLMSNERLTRPQLILSLYLCCFPQHQVYHLENTQPPFFWTLFEDYRG